MHSFELYNLVLFPTEYPFFFKKSFYLWHDIILELNQKKRNWTRISNVIIKFTLGFKENVYISWLFLILRTNSVKHCYTQSRGNYKLWDDNLQVQDCLVKYLKLQPSFSWDVSAAYSLIRQLLAVGATVICTSWPLVPCFQRNHICCLRMSTCERCDAHGAL